MMRDPWEYDAACATIDPELFFAGDDTASYRDVAAAKTICGGCPVRRECLELGLDFPRDGIFGGYTAKERHKMRKASA